MIITENLIITRSDPVLNFGAALLMQQAMAIEHTYQDSRAQKKMKKKSPKIVKLKKAKRREHPRRYIFSRFNVQCPRGL